MFENAHDWWGTFDRGMVPFRGKLSGSVGIMRVKEPAKPRILIVEDSFLISLDLQRIVEESGCEIAGTSTDVARALAVLEGESVDLALVDCKLEGEDCSAVVRALRQKKIPFVICSVLDRPELDASYPDANIVTKPYRADTLVAALTNLLGDRLPHP